MTERDDGTDNEADPAPSVAVQLTGAEWAEIAATAPRVAAPMRRYLRQLGTFLAPQSVDAADGALRQFARWAWMTDFRNSF
jgi:hypothetical protein